NREVKPNGADGTASQWESRTPPFFKKREREGGDRISTLLPGKKGEGESLESEALSFFIFSLSKNHFAFLSIPLYAFSFSFLSSLLFPFIFLSFSLFILSRTQQRIIGHLLSSPLLRVILIK
ncbi:hypothetical protein, partial [Porphyromonas gingivalis]|uniref:hypothetical protein n=1 Tax=Porphyromonas gingivalis TaxID=837 RepID=UPI001C5334A4